MSYKQMVKDLKLANEQQFLDLLKRNPCEPLIYLLKVQESVGVKPLDYYKILAQKYKEENNDRLYRLVREYEFVLRDDREREKDW